MLNDYYRGLREAAATAFKKSEITLRATLPGEYDLFKDIPDERMRIREKARVYERIIERNEAINIGENAKDLNAPDYVATIEAMQTLHQMAQPGFPGAQVERSALLNLLNYGYENGHGTPHIAGNIIRDFVARHGVALVDFYLRGQHGDARIAAQAEVIGYRRRFSLGNKAIQDVRILDAQDCKTLRDVTSDVIPSGLYYGVVKSSRPEGIAVVMRPNADEFTQGYNFAEGVATQLRALGFRPTDSRTRLSHNGCQNVYLYSCDPHLFSALHDSGYIDEKERAAFTARLANAQAKTQIKAR